MTDQEITNTIFKARDILDDATGRGEELIRRLHEGGIVLGEELPLISQDEYLRLEALTIANDRAIDHGVSAEHVIGRAEIFLDYIKNGVQTDA